MPPVFLGIMMRWGWWPYHFFDDLENILVETSVVLILINVKLLKTDANFSNFEW